MRRKWWVTPWSLNPEGGWSQQPVILLEGQQPFFAENPQPYIEELERMRLDPELETGPWHTLIGQFQDALEQTWRKPTGVISDGEKSTH